MSSRISSNARTGDVNKRIGEMITSRQRLIGLETALDTSHGTTCVKYVRTTEITGQFPAFPDVVAISVTRGLNCLHPFRKQYQVDVTFQQLYAKGQKALSLEDDADASSPSWYCVAEFDGRV